MDVRAGVLFEPTQIPWYRGERNPAILGSAKDACAAKIQNVNLFGLEDYFRDVNCRLSAHLALGDLIRLITAGTAFIV